MHKPIDLIVLMRGVTGCSPSVRQEFFPEYERLLSQRDRPFKYKEQEFESLSSFMGKCYRSGLSEEGFRGFAYSYSIPRISKEFDLLKIGNDAVLDIELKSKAIPIEEIEEQLRQNRYYLSFLGRQTSLLCFCAEDGGLLTLRGEGLVEMDWDDAVKLIESVVPVGPETDYDLLFEPRNYLVSPIMEPDRFLNGEYFLTSQQEDVKKIVLGYLDEEGSGGHIVTGDAGTGKTLLLYDIAKAMALRTEMPAAIFHGAGLSDYHRTFNNKCAEIRVLPPNLLGLVDVTRYCFVGFDEAHRMYPEQFTRTIRQINDAEVPYLVMLDSKQRMSATEEARDIEAIAAKLVPSERQLFNLTNKFRTNKNVANFVSCMFNGARGGGFTSEGISVEFVPKEESLEPLVKRYEAQGYTYIAMSESMYVRSSLNEYHYAGCPNTHGVIGLEFDSVVMIVPEYVMFDGKNLCDGLHPNPDYLPTKLLYQGLTRARDRIALLCHCDWDVFRYIVGLLTDKIVKKDGLTEV